MPFGSGQKVRKVPGRLGPRWPPFKTVVTVTASEIRLKTRGTVRALQFIAVGTAFALSGVGVWVVGLGPRAPAPLDLWLPLVAVGALSLAAGAWQCRDFEECSIDAGSGQATFTRRRAFGTRRWHADAGDLGLRFHSVELDRPGFQPTWKGHAMCLWHRDELAMVLAVGRNVEYCKRIIAEGGPQLEELYHGDGDVLISTL
jgi:hypothetical protein